MTHQIIKSLLQKKLAFSGQTTNGKILSNKPKEIYSDSLFLFVNNGRLEILKSQFREYFSRRSLEFPISTEISFDQFLSDIKTTCNSHHYLDLLDETDNKLVFDFNENIVLLTFEYMKNIEVQSSFKNYLSWYHSNTSSLTHWNNRPIYYDTDKKIIKFIDFSSVWYSDITPDPIINTKVKIDFFIDTNDTDLFLYSFAKTITPDHQLAINWADSFSKENSLKFNIITVE